MRPEIYQLKITTITPLHIGTGNTLLQDFDFVSHQGSTWVINEDELANLLYSEGGDAFERMAQGEPAGDLIQNDEYARANPLFRYVMKGKVRAGSRGAQLQEQIKDAWDRPYIPGSSLKGALRTAIMFVMWGQRDYQLDVNQLGRNAKFAAQSVEGELLMGEKPRPNYDIMRALQVADSQPDLTQSLEVKNMSVVVGKKDPAAPIEIEAVKHDVTFTTTITLDSHLLHKDQRQQLGWDKLHRQLLKNIPTVANLWTQTRLESDAARPRQGNWKSMYEFLLREYAGKHLADDEFILQLGWGGGWDSKTMGAQLTTDEGKFAQLVGKYGLDKTGKFEPGERFPKSRRVALNSSNNPLYTLGWVKVKMERVQ
jgi:CRISPR-associated protein Csm5